MRDRSDRYVRKAEVLDIVDGDTVHLRVDLGMDVYHKITVRLQGIDTPEIFRPKSKKEKEHGLAAKEYLTRMIPPRTTVLIKTYKDKKGKYGRYLADIRVNNVNVVQALIDAGFEKKSRY